MEKGGGGGGCGRHKVGGWRLRNAGIYISFTNYANYAKWWNRGPIVTSYLFTVILYVKYKSIVIIIPPTEGS